MACVSQYIAEPASCKRRPNCAKVMPRSTPEAPGSASLAAWPRPTTPRTPEQRSAVDRRKLLSRRPPA
eukprot:2016578-Alexandrium_andersonii.AAC.1